MVKALHVFLAHIAVNLNRTVVTSITNIGTSLTFRYDNCTDNPVLRNRVHSKKEMRNKMTLGQDFFIRLQTII